MKNLNKVFAIAIVILGSAATSFAQVGVTTTATASGTVITPISITKTTDMNFGNLAVNANAGTVILTPSAGRTPSGGVTLPNVTGTVASAAFTVAGLAASTYSITLPSTYTITRVSGSETMTVNAFTSNPTPTGVIGAGGNQTLSVGATLNVTGSQVAGVYTNAVGFDVSVNYN